MKLIAVIGAYYHEEHGFIIGDKDGNLVNNDKADKNLFRDITDGSIIVAGRKTCESIPCTKKLPNRYLICMSRSESAVYSHPSIAAVCDSKASFYRYLLEKGKGISISFDTENIFIIGGAEIYNEFADDLDEVIITEFNEMTLKCDPSEYVSLSNKTTNMILSDFVPKVVNVNNGNLLSNPLEDIFPLAELKPVEKEFGTICWMERR